MDRTAEAATFTTIILEVFRLNGLLLSQGDRLTEPHGLTSARWQILGALELAGQPLSVAQIGRRMGLSRQGVQRISNDLETLGFVRFEENPDHARAKLVVLRKKGIEALKHIDLAQIEWSNNLTKGMSSSQLDATVELLRELRSRCEAFENKDVKTGSKTDV